MTYHLMNEKKQLTISLFLNIGLQKFVAKPGSSATVTSEETFGTKRKQETQAAGSSKKKPATEW